MLMNTQLWQSIHTLQCHDYITLTMAPASITPRNCSRYYTAVTAPTVFWSAFTQPRRFHLSEVLCVCFQGCMCVIGHEPRFQNWVCCKVSKVINVSHQASHLSRISRKWSQGVLSSPLLPSWTNWKAQVSVHFAVNRGHSSSSHAFAEKESSCGTSFIFRCSVILGCFFSALSVMERTVDPTFEMEWKWSIAV